MPGKKRKVVEPHIAYLCFEHTSESTNKVSGEELKSVDILTDDNDYRLPEGFALEPVYGFDSETTWKILNHSAGCFYRQVNDIIEKDPEKKDGIVVFVVLTFDDDTSIKSGDRTWLKQKKYRIGLRKPYVNFRNNLHWGKKDGNFVPIFDDSSDPYTTAGTTEINIVSRDISIIVNLESRPYIRDENYFSMIEDLVNIYEDIVLDENSGTYLNKINNWKNDLDKLDNLLKKLPSVAETNLEKRETRKRPEKIRNYTSITMYDLYSNPGAKARTLMDVENYDIYEHRMIRSYVENLSILSVRRIKKIEGEIGENVREDIKDIIDLRDMIKEKYDHILKKHRDHKIPSIESVPKENEITVTIDYHKCPKIWLEEYYLRQIGNKEKDIIFKYGNSGWEGLNIEKFTNGKEPYNIFVDSIPALEWLYRNAPKSGAFKVSFTGFIDTSSDNRHKNLFIKKIEIVNGRSWNCGSNINPDTDLSRWVLSKKEDFANYIIDNSLKKLLDDYLGFIKNKSEIHNTYKNLNNEKKEYTVSADKLKKYYTYIRKEKNLNEELGYWRSIYDRTEKILDQDEVISTVRCKKPSERLHLTNLFAGSDVYRRIFSLIGKQHVDDIFKIGFDEGEKMALTKACNVYEYWCFIRILRIFTEEYRYKPDKDSPGLKELIEEYFSSSGKTRESLEITMSRKIPRIKDHSITLIYQGALTRIRPKGNVYPDFQLIVNSYIFDAGIPRPKTFRFVFDAKYRDFYGSCGEPRNRLLLDVSAKKYLLNVKEDVHGSYLLFPVDSGRGNLNDPYRFTDYYGYNVVSLLASAALDSSHKNDPKNNSVMENENIYRKKLKEKLNIPCPDKENDDINDGKINSRIGSVGFYPGKTKSFKNLIRMIMERIVNVDWDAQYAYNDPSVCWMCGNDSFEVLDDYRKENINWKGKAYLCSNTMCEDRFMVKNYCGKCGEPLIKHSYHYHDYARSVNVMEVRPWNVKCPNCYSVLVDKM